METDWYLRAHPKRKVTPMSESASTLGIPIAGSARERILGAAYELFSRHGTQSGRHQRGRRAGGRRQTDAVPALRVEGRAGRRVPAPARGALDEGLAPARGRAARHGARRTSARDLRRLPRLVPARRHGGLLLHQRPAGGRRPDEPGATGHGRAPRGNPRRSSRRSPETRESPTPRRFARRWHILMKGSIVSAQEGDLEAAHRAQEIGRVLLERERAGLLE